MTETKLPGVLLIEPRVIEDERGCFFESWQAERYAEMGIPSRFVQDNVSFSRRGVLRGLHFQNPYAQAKLVCVLHGAVYDVAVDLRLDSSTFAQWVGVELSSENRRQLFVPEGFAHGFAALSEQAVVSYKCSALYAPKCEQTLRWDDPDIGIEWPVRAPVLSAKDAAGWGLSSIPQDRLFAPAMVVSP